MTPHQSASSADERAIISAAEAWACAVEAIAEAEERGRDIALEREAMTVAKIALYEAVLALRAARRPARFTGVRGSKARRRFSVVDLLGRV